MSSEIIVHLKQTSATTTEGSVRGHSVLIDRPLAKEGTDKGAMGGELFLISLGGCFMSNLLEAVRTRSAPVSNIKVEIVGTLEPSPTRYTAIKLKISAEYADTELIEKLVTMSERACIVANSIRHAIDLTFEIQQAQSVAS